MHEWLKDVVNSIKVPSDIVKKTLEPSAREIGEGLGNLFYLAFSPLQKHKLKKEYEINQFTEELNTQLSRISPENIHEPHLSIAGPTLEAVKYYIEDSELRAMFAKLLASSMDYQKDALIHPSFVEILKQLSPLDAECLKHLFISRYKGPRIGCGHYEATIKEESNEKNLILYRYLFPFANMDFSNFTVYLASIENLMRLELIKVDTDVIYADDEFYSGFKNNVLIEEIREHVYKEFDENSDTNIEISVEFKKDSWEFTQFGKNFCITCIN